MRSKKSDLNNFKEHLTISLSIDPSLSKDLSISRDPSPSIPQHAVTNGSKDLSISRDPSPESSLQKDISPQHASAVHSAGTEGKAVIEISSSWMAASLENALKTVKDSSVVVSGFRPGKVPAQLLRKKKTPIAIDTMLNWILQDLGEVLDSYDSFQILTPGTFSFEPSWREGEPFRVEATFNYWRFPDISIDDICEAIGKQAAHQGLMIDDGDESLDWIGDVLGQLFVPYISLDVQQIAVQSYLDQKSGVVSNDDREAALAAVCRNMGAAFVIKRLGIDISEDDIKKNIGLVAAAKGVSFYDLYDGLIEEGGVETYRQHLQLMGAWSAIAHRVSGLQSNEKAFQLVSDQEVTAP